MHTGLDALYFILPIKCARTACHNDKVPWLALLLLSWMTALTPILTACYAAQGIHPLLCTDVTGPEDPEYIVDKSPTTGVSTTHPPFDHHKVPSPGKSSAEVRLC